MQIYGREVLSCEQLWDLYKLLISSDDIWHKENFIAAAKECGLKRVTEREGYFSFTFSNHTTGQAPIVNGLIEEIRLFIGNEPRQLDETAWRKDKHKHSLLAEEYSEIFTDRLGSPRIANNNDIFEYNGYRVRVLASSTVWVVISNQAIIKQLPNDWWSL
jgi:hypothetical protein